MRTDDVIVESKEWKMPWKISHRPFETSRMFLYNGTMYKWYDVQWYKRNFHQNVLSIDDETSKLRSISVGSQFETTNLKVELILRQRI